MAITLVLVCSTVNYVTAANIESKQIFSEEELMITEALELAKSIDYEEELVRAEHGVSDIPVTKEMLDGCSATKTGEDGKVEELDINATVRNVGSITRQGEEKKFML